YVLVDFWGSWCRPCRSEHENLRKTYRMFRYKGFEIFQVAIERNKTDWKNTLREDKLYWKYQVSELNYMESETAKAYRVKAIPANYLLDPNGIVVAQNLYGDALIEKLNELLNPVAGVTN
ncbi:MAG: TlpA family protein disulfide reductase, partial [Salinivirgaceae bacterium]